MAGVDERNFSSRVDESPIDRDPRAISWLLEGSEKIGQIVVWEDGNAEVDLAYLMAGDARSRHHTVDDQQDLEKVLGEVYSWVVL